VLFGVACTLNGFSTVLLGPPLVLAVLACLPLVRGPPANRD
jgi:hypothetical protein